jgi:phage tail protein X
MNRYADIRTYKTATVITYQGVTRYPEIPYSENDIYVITTDGDRLDNLAYEYYGDATLYWVISAANPTQTYSLLYPVIGTQLRIPFPVDAVIDSFNNLNNG